VERKRLEVKTMAKTAEELGKEREKRVRDAIGLEVPDRVPVVPIFEFFPAFYSGITPREAMYDYDKAYQAYKKTILDFEPDMYAGPALFRSGPVLEALDCKQVRWPGYSLEAHLMYQFVEKENMLAEEYHEFIHDPSDWLLRKYLPRVYGALGPIGKLPGLFDQFYYYGAPSAGLAMMGTSEIQEALTALLKAARESLAWVNHLIAFANEMRGLGFNSFFFVATYAPFDMIGDNFRGTRQIMLDMYRRSDELLEALETTTEITIVMATRRAAAGGIPIVFIPLHKGSDNFMSQEHYEIFYWPFLKKLITGIIDAGLIPYVYTEGSYTSRLETIRDVPKGKVLYHFEKVDLKMAKEIMGDVACISGNVPNSILATGSPRDVREYCKTLIDVVGKGGGLIVDAAATIDEAKPENVKAMIDVTKEYGVYG
jgi:Uroporphyrinogen decarboxylase (URO-D)